MLRFRRAGSSLIYNELDNTLGVIMIFMYFGIMYSGKNDDLRLSIDTNTE